MKGEATLRRPNADFVGGFLSALVACAISVAAPAISSASASASANRPYAGSVRALIAERNLAAALTRLRA